MDVVFEGALSRSWSMADVLRGVMGVEAQPYGILRVSSPGSNVSGRLAIAESRFIIGGLLSDGSEAGYSAVRRLLMAGDGNFAYLDTGGKKPPEYDQGLYIPLGKMAEIWPALPEDPEELFDEKSLLDKVFGPGEKFIDDDPASGHYPVIEQQPNKQRPTRASLLKAMQEATNAAPQITSGPQPKQNWRTMVKPLLSNSLVDGAKTIEGHISELEDTAAHGRQSLTNLRAADVEERPWLQQMVADSFGGKLALVWLALIVGILLAVSFFVFRPNG